MAEEDRERIQLSAAQVAASSLAAVSAAIVCSFFGVAGTVIGTAAASVVATVGGAVYSWSLRRTRARLRRLHQTGAASPPFREVVKTLRMQGHRMWEVVPARLLAIGIVGVFALSIGVVTVIELGLGKPLATALGVGGSGDTGPSLANWGNHSGGRTSHSPTPSKSATPTPAHTPTATSTAGSTHSPTASPTPTPTASRTTPGNILSSLVRPSGGG